MTLFHNNFLSALQKNRITLHTPQQIQAQERTYQQELEQRHHAHQPHQQQPQPGHRRRRSDIHDVFEC